MDRGLTLRTYLWLAGSLFIVAASFSFLAYLRFGLPWWAMVVAMGTLVGAIVGSLEHAIARPLERLTKVSQKSKDGVTAPPPGGLFSADEIRTVWKGVRASQEQLVHAKHAHRAVEGKLSTLQDQFRMLVNASQALRPDVPLAEVAPGVLKELAAHLGLSDLYLVPLRRHCPVPVLGGHWAPMWGDAVRQTGLSPWNAILEQGTPVTIGLTEQAPEWREHFKHQTLWVTPLNYHGKAQGILLAVITGPERTWTPEELALIDALGQMLAAALHPPRWSEERKQPAKGDALEAVVEQAAQVEQSQEEIMAELEAVQRTRRRRRQKQGA